MNTDYYHSPFGLSLRHILYMTLILSDQHISLLHRLYKSLSHYEERECQSDMFRSPILQRLAGTFLWRKPRS